MAKWLNITRIMFFTIRCVKTQYSISQLVSDVKTCVKTIWWIQIITTSIHLNLNCLFGVPGQNLWNHPSIKLFMNKAVTLTPFSEEKTCYQHKSSNMSPKHTKMSTKSDQPNQAERHLKTHVNKKCLQKESNKNRTNKLEKTTIYKWTYNIL